VNCKVIKQKKDTLKKSKEYQFVNLALKKIMKEKIKKEILKK